MKYDRIKDLTLHRNDIVWVSLTGRWKKDNFVGYEGPARVEKFNRFQDTKKWSISLEIPIFDNGALLFVPRQVLRLEKI